MYCGNCGAMVNEGERFCSNCGKRIEAPRPAKPVCSKCGKAMENGMRFCPSCGGRAVGAQAGNHVNPANTGGGINQGAVEKCRLTINRPKKVYGCAMTFNVTIDGKPNKYALKNGQQVIIELSKGMHSIEVGMMGVLQKTRASINLTGDRIISCRINSAGTTSNGLLGGPAVLEDEYGRAL